MRRTLLAIPHEIAGLPVFGFGWVLILAAVAMVLRLVWARSRGQLLSEVLKAEGMIWGALAAAIVWLLPMVELENLQGEPIGMAIRGYGVMLLVGVASAVALAWLRAKRAGEDPEVILALVPWVFIGGIVGARLFFVIQYHDRFLADSLTETIGNIFRFTEGGLVVYGSFIGGFLAATFFLVRHRLPWFKMGDIIVPCLFIGLFFGRIGCLMNGCCYGGRCEESWYALHFPPTSPVYQDQIRSGELLGFSYDRETRRVIKVEPGSLADQAGVSVGGRLEELVDDQSRLPDDVSKLAREDIRRGVIATIDGKRYRWSVDQLPDRALPVVPAQWISSLSSGLLCLLLCAIPLGKFRPGTIMMISFAAYALLRFGLEIVRVDEAGQFGTRYSISQWVSVVVLACCAFGMIWIYCSSPPKVAGHPAPENQ